MKTLPKIISRCVIVILFIIAAIWGFKKCTHVNDTNVVNIKPSPSYTPLNKAQRDTLSVTEDTTKVYKKKSDLNKPKVAKNKKVLHNTLRQIIADTLKTDSLLQFAKSANDQMKIDSAIKANQEKQISTLKKIDTTNNAIKDSIITDNKKVADATKDEAIKDEKRAKSNGRYQGVIITVAVAILVKIGLSLIK